MKVVKVYGALQEKLGQSHFEFEVNTPAQAVRALCANFDGLAKWLVDSEKDGVGYQVLVGKEQVTEDNIETLNYPWSERDVFSITPVIAGSGRGFGQILFGALLIGAAFLTAGATVGAAGGLFSSAGWKAAAWSTKALTMFGASMVLGGISTMLTPVPPSPREAQKNESYGFGGIGNNVNQGLPVPICYGRLFIGSSTISVGLDTDETI